MKKKNFQKVINQINFNFFPNIWMDFRIAMYLKYISNNFFILERSLTYYRQSSTTISVNSKFLSIPWWKRRIEAHAYLRFFFLKNKIKYKKNLDYLLCNLVNFLIK